MGKKTKNESQLRDLIDKLEETLGKEIDSLSETLQEVTPDKRIDFITKTLPVLIKYKESHSSGWEVPEWE